MRTCIHGRNCWILKYTLCICFAYFMCHNLAPINTSDYADQHIYQINDRLENEYIFQINETSFDGLQCKFNKLLPLNVVDLVNHLHNQPESIDITLVTHTSCERIGPLYKLAQVWSGAIIVSLFLNKVQGCSDEQLSDIHNISFNHTNMLVLKVEAENQLLYPFNALRVIASRRAITSHILYLDVDIIPNAKVYTILKAKLQEKSLMNIYGINKTALILPTFELKQTKRPSPVHYPLKDREELLQWIENGFIQPARLQRFFPGHGPTRYDKWMNTSTPYFVSYQLGFEPYVLVPKASPVPDPRFIGHARDKSTFVLQLHAYGFKFCVLNDSFVVHFEHRPSATKLKAPDYNLCNIAAFEHLAKAFGVPIKYPKINDPL